ncbi:hypothetical protein E2C01_008553 [Portunus trituberculatus]|uniref:Uncharacterized protein n=1 Tax=Portunus trituberculatus TaxID=210409 RepID=A0A5B7D3G0_PORTR|nr:hypothetical protein [Portunus trituberculatus]
MYSQTKEFVYRINRYFLKEKACKDHFYPQIKQGRGQHMQLGISHPASTSYTASGTPPAAPRRPGTTCTMAH